MPKLLRNILIFALPLGLFACDDQAASLSLQLKNFTFEKVDNLNRFSHIREFQEHTGIGVTLTKGKVCVEDKKTCVEAVVNYRIDASSYLQQKGHHFATTRDHDIITLEYWGVDDEGNDIKVKTIIEINGEKVTVIEATS